MTDHTDTQQETSVILLGASFETGNLGVSALAWSSIRVIAQRWPNAKVTFLGAGRKPTTQAIKIQDREWVIEAWPVRYCFNIFAENHIAVLLLGSFLSRLCSWCRRRWQGNRSSLGVLLNSSIVMDITGGDSFSDIYGMNRFLKGYLLKQACLTAGKAFILLPQTYGPFQHKLTRLLARGILRRATKVFSRDQEGIEQVESLIGTRYKDRLALYPDVAFCLEAAKVTESETINRARQAGKPLIGLNVSGLLYNNGYTGLNEFGLILDYSELIKEVIRYFVTEENAQVLLISHVVPKKDSRENDLEAAQCIYNDLSQELQAQVLIMDGQYDQCQVKSLIGQCEFFIGSRMHSTIAALSQCVPTIGLAYSKKFVGVYEMIDMQDQVLDMRSLREDQILTAIKRAYQCRDNLRHHLTAIIPDTKNKVLSIGEVL